MIEIYVDGSVGRGKGSNYSGAIVVFKNNHIIHEACGIGDLQNTELISMRNIAGELSAAMRAASWLLLNDEKGTIVYDYKGIEYFATGVWQANNDYTKGYHYYMKPLIDKGIIDFRHVKGHTKVFGNELADKLAKRALRLGIRWEDKW